MSLEDTFIEIALNHDREMNRMQEEEKDADAPNSKGTVIICDRGVMDGYAYTEHNVW
jgi:hypothetical protein